MGCSIVLLLRILGLGVHQVYPQLYPSNKGCKLICISKVYYNIIMLCSLSTAVCVVVSILLLGPTQKQVSLCSYMAIIKSSFCMPLLEEQVQCNASGNRTLTLLWVMYSMPAKCDGFSFALAKASLTWSEVD